MKTFLEHLAESAPTFNADRFKNLQRFAGAKASGMAVRFARQEAAIDRLGAAIAEGVIYNPVLNEIKLHVIRVMEDIYSELRFSVYEDKMRANKFADDADSLYGMVSVKKLQKHWAAHKAEYPLIAEFMDISVDLKAALDHAKTIVKAGAPPKPADPNKFVKPTAAYDVQKEVAKVLTDAVTPIRAELIAGTEEYIRNQVATIRAKIEANPKAPLTKGTDDKLLGIYSRVTKKVAERGVLQRIEMLPAAEVAAFIKSEALYHVDNVIMEFVGKNTSKLALIIEKKKMVEHTVVSNNVRGPSLENTMALRFEDGSSFRIYSQIEYGWAPKSQKTFVKLVTRFTDVVLAGGKRMTQPSEEKMIKEF